MQHFCTPLFDEIKIFTVQKKKKKNDVYKGPGSSFLMRQSSSSIFYTEAYGSKQVGAQNKRKKSEAARRM